MTKFAIKSYATGTFSKTEKKVSESQLELKNDGGWKFLNFGKKGNIVSRVEAEPVKEVAKPKFHEKLWSDVKGTTSKTVKAVSGSEYTHKALLGVSEGAGVVIGSTLTAMILDKLFPVKQQEETQKPEIKVEEPVTNSAPVSDAKTNSRLDVLEKRMSQMEAQVTTMETTINEGFDAFHSSFDDLEKDFKGVSTKIDDLMNLFNPSDKQIAKV